MENDLNYKPGYWKLIAWGEPFRLLFPIGVLIGIFGVLLWPLFAFGNGIIPYPNQAHARIMIEGFLSCFVFGFLGTALPRLLDVPKITIYETCAAAISFLLISYLHFVSKSQIADGLFILLLIGLISALSIRLFFRKDTPPPGFVLVGMGIASSLAGAILCFFTFQISPWAAHLSKLLLYQGYLLFPIMGIGAFLLPRFFGLPNNQNFPESLALPPGWIGKALFAIACGVVIIGSFFLEAFDFLHAAYAIRAVTVATYLVREIPLHKATSAKGSLALALRIALFSIPFGYFSIAVFPDAYRLTLLHVVFITGFSLLTLTVASRVVFGHSGQSQFFRARIYSIDMLVGLIVLAMLVRVTADWIPKVQIMHYGFAAIIWIFGVLIWAIRCFPSLHLPDDE